MMTDPEMKTHIRMVLLTSALCCCVPLAANATVYCYSGGCFTGVDETGRGPDASREAVQEILDHAKPYPEATLAVARQAIKDNATPASRDRVAEKCTREGNWQTFNQCLAVSHGTETWPEFKGEAITRSAGARGTGDRGGEAGQAGREAR